MQKRVLALLLTVVMVFSLAGCKGKNDTGISTEPTTAPVDTTDEPTEAPTQAPAEPSGQIIIGSTTDLSGEFIPYFQNGAADNDIFYMTNGYPTTDITDAGEFVVDKTVVKDYKVTSNEDGSKTYTWTINNNLVWNDGTPITAKDYVANLLLWSSKQIADMGANNTIVGMYFKGFTDFSSGKTKEFSGVNLISDDTFAVTIDASNLPYFFELGLVQVQPTKLSFWTDDKVTISDDGKGAYFSDNFTVENYKDKINAARTKVPAITCGAYNAVSFNGSAKEAVIEVNPKYLGNRDGQKPSIKTIIYKKVTTETALDELSTGSVDLLNGMSSGDEINAGLDLVDKGGFAYSSYDRNGYGKLQFACDFGPTQFVEVRQAIAHLLDRNDFAKAFTGGFGSVVNGPYGPAMWMYQDTKDTLDEKLDSYPYSLDDAVKLLEDGGWVYGKDGKDYTSGVRYKKLDDGTLMPLVIEWASSEQNPVSELLVVKLQNNPDVAAAGIKINQTVMTFTELLSYLYRDGSNDKKYEVPTYNMFNLATGFTPIYDMVQQYTIKGGDNTNFIKDEELDKLTKDMVLVDPADKTTFESKFVSFIEKWNYLLPDIPLYSNLYHDFYNAKLKNYNPNGIWDMKYALMYASVEEQK
ncbi:ABC transporter substrate-binding protein [Anaerocolumna xylanovorans]|uniref:Peptide/nickel transport system substrate-binding protein n=1 Tax=Anaerocolumna xylanovorans DSM 12503 TaxID=1121345 RepID=A0A1M7YJ51_9FIRM|nr:ABC transporter substrate-binding protein [Anaerocolumna xylanovorans]SHO52643.1 peptide/nickel transport system substrate-binding protein [Anaerocolumna xylanovorans DSM 12503]